MWLRQLRTGHEAKTHSSREARVRGSEALAEWWEVHQPIITALVRTADVVVACDPERVHYAPGAPAVLWGWSVCSGDIVYGLGIKRSVTKASREMACEIAADVLGNRLTQHQRTVMELVDLHRLGLIPAFWGRERGWIQSLCKVSERIVSDDTLYADVARYIVDPDRARWVPCSKRAA